MNNVLREHIEYDEVTCSGSLRSLAALRGAMRRGAERSGAVCGARDECLKPTPPVFAPRGDVKYLMPG